MSQRELFIAAVQKLDQAERAAYLDQACAGDTALRHRVEVLLQAHEQASGFLEQPAVAAAGTGGWTPPSEIEKSDRPAGKFFAAAPLGPAVGDRIGPYKLLQKLGEGGMGTVWVAEQTEPVKRRVALKLIKPGMDSAQVIRRFEAERQALALMDHANIAKVLDAGTTHGEPAGPTYFVMELVKGVPITSYCDELAPAAPRTAGTVRAGLPGHPARPPKGHHPPRHQAVERAGCHAGRQARAQGHRLRRRQGRCTSG